MYFFPKQDYNKIIFFGRKTLFKIKVSSLSTNQNPDELTLFQVLFKEYKMEGKTYGPTSKNVYFYSRDCR